jgi:hypothetical protein
MVAYFRKQTESKAGLQNNKNCIHVDAVPWKQMLCSS